MPTPLPHPFEDLFEEIDANTDYLITGVGEPSWLVRMECDDDLFTPNPLKWGRDRH